MARTVGMMKRRRALMLKARRPSTSRRRWRVASLGLPYVSEDGSIMVTVHWDDTFHPPRSSHLRKGDIDSLRPVGPNIYQVSWKPTAEHAINLLGIGTLDRDIRDLFQERPELTSRAKNIYLQRELQRRMPPNCAHCTKGKGPRGAI